MGPVVKGDPYSVSLFGINEKVSVRIPSERLEIPSANAVVADRMARSAKDVFFMFIMTIATQLVSRLASGDSATWAETYHRKQNIFSRIFHGSLFGS